MSIYEYLYQCATDPHLIEGRKLANNKALRWKNTLQDILKVADSTEHYAISQLLAAICKFLDHPANNDPWYYLKRDEPFLPGDEAIEIDGNTWFPIVDSVAENLNNNPKWALARRLKVR